MHRKPELISHWYTLIVGLQTSSVQFYTALEGAIRDRRLPTVTACHVLWRESGPFSSSREYLRVVRGRVAFDVCAAPFGNDFFFSWRLAILPPKYGWLYLLILIAGGLIGFHSFQNFNYANSATFSWLAEWYWRTFHVPPSPLFSTGAAIIIPLILLFLIFVANGEDAMLAIPIFGWIYEKLFAQETYYRIDTALMYQEEVRRAVTEVIDGVLNQKGLRALSDQEKEPRLQPFARR